MSNSNQERSCPIIIPKPSSSIPRIVENNERRTAPSIRPPLSQPIQGQRIIRQSQFRNQQRQNVPQLEQNQHLNFNSLNSTQKVSNKEIIKSQEYSRQLKDKENILLNANKVQESELYSNLLSHLSTHCSTTEKTVNGANQILNNNVPQSIEKVGSSKIFNVNNIEIKNRGMLRSYSLNGELAGTNKQQQQQMQLQQQQQQSSEKVNNYFTYQSSRNSLNNLQFQEQKQEQEQEQEQEQGSLDESTVCFNSIESQDLSKLVSAFNKHKGNLQMRDEISKLEEKIRDGQIVMFKESEYFMNREMFMKPEYIVFSQQDFNKLLIKQETLQDTLIKQTTKINLLEQQVQLLQRQQEAKKDFNKKVNEFESLLPLHSEKEQSFNSITFQQFDSRESESLDQNGLRTNSLQHTFGISRLQNGNPLEIVKQQPLTNKGIAQIQLPLAKYNHDIESSRGKFSKEQHHQKLQASQSRLSDEDEEGKPLSVVQETCRNYGSRGVVKVGQCYFQDEVQTQRRAVSLESQRELNIIKRNQQLFPHQYVTAQQSSNESANHNKNNHKQIFSRPPLGSARGQGTRKTTERSEFSTLQNETLHTFSIEEAETQRQRTQSTEQQSKENCVIF